MHNFADHGQLKIRHETDAYMYVKLKKERIDLVTKEDAYVNILCI